MLPNTQTKPKQMKKDRTMNPRVRMIREALRLQSNEMAQELHMGPSSYSAIESERNTVSRQVIGMLEARFNVNPQWLRTGEGNMFKNKGPKESEHGDHLVINDVSKSALLARIADLERELEQKDKIINALIKKP
jgi:DNA-binding XRE family transcriptional regulator